MVMYKSLTLQKVEVSGCCRHVTLERLSLNIKQKCICFEQKNKIEIISEFSSEN